MARLKSSKKSPRRIRSSCSQLNTKQSRKPLPPAHVVPQPPSRSSPSLQVEDQTPDNLDDPNYDWLSNKGQGTTSLDESSDDLSDVGDSDEVPSPLRLPDAKTLKKMPLEEKIRAASKYLEAKGSTNMTKACNLFGIKQGKDYARFRRRHQGLNQPARFAQVKSQRLSPAQEVTLVEWCIYLAIMGVPLNKTTILPRAQIILGITDPKKTPGSSWLRRFLRRYHDVLKNGRPGGLDPQRARCFNKDAVMKHFDEFKAEILDRGVRPENMWNMDEKGLQLSGARKNRQQKYILPSGIRSAAYTIRSDNLELVTVIECVSAAGEAMKPTFIFSGKSFSSIWFEHDNYEEVSAVAHSANGWTDDELAHEWFEKVAIPHMKAVMRRIAGSPDADEWIAMISDGHGSHEHLKMRETALENKILLYSLPPHTTHNLQPLDVGVFGILQRRWAERCEILARQAAIGSVLDDGEEVVGAASRGMTRNVLIPEYIQLRRDAFKKLVIQCAWEKTGMWPFNRDKFDDAAFAPSYLSSTTTHLPPSFPTPPRRIQPHVEPSQSCDRPDNNHNLGTVTIPGGPSNNLATLDQVEAEVDASTLSPPLPPANPQTPSTSSPLAERNSISIGTESFYSTPSDRQAPSQQAYQRLPRFPLPSPLKKRAEIPSGSTPLQHKSLKRSTSTTSKTRNRSSISSLTRELDRANERISHLEDQNRRIEARMERAEANAKMVAIDYSQLKEKVNSSSTAKKNKGIHFQVERRLLTSVEGVEAARKAVAEKNEAKRLEVEKRATRKAAEDERETQRILKASSNIYSGSLKSKSKAELQDILCSLYQIASSEERADSKLDHREGTVAILTTRVQDYLEGHPGLSSSKQFAGLFPGGSRMSRRQGVEVVGSQYPPNQLAIPQAQPDTTATTQPALSTSPNYSQPSQSLATPTTIPTPIDLTNPYTQYNVPYPTYLYPHHFYAYSVPSSSMPTTK